MRSWWWGTLPKSTDLKLHCLLLLFCFLFIFERISFTMLIRLTSDLQWSASLCLPHVEIKSLDHHTWLKLKSWIIPSFNTLTFGFFPPSWKVFASWEFVSKSTNTILQARRSKNSPEMFEIKKFFSQFKNKILSSSYGLAPSGLHIDIHIHVCELLHTHINTHTHTHTKWYH